MIEPPDPSPTDPAARNRRLYDLFSQALDLPETQRDVFLQRSCGEDHALRADVLALIMEHTRDRAPVADAPAPPSVNDDVSIAPGQIGPGTVIGRYTLVRVIGAGTFGTVYQAMQNRPVHRTVALKLLNPGMQSPEVLRRFRVEFQSLALLSHPNIASVFDAGEVRPGVPYFVMEFVPGVSLTRYCRENKLDLRARLSLFCQACDAAHYAHIQGVIHRDLKPGNILVVPPLAGSPASATPTLKIVDFGLARSTQTDAQITAVPTEVGAILGTLAYMAPEQALGTPADIDRRADIYSLGVIAYELLAGQLPFDVQSRAIVEALRAIQHDEPSRLSSINRALRGDIETIVGKAMEKEKSRRYALAADLSADIGRYLRDEPITARPASTWYQLSKFTRRNKPLVGGMVGVVLVLIVGLITTTWQMTRARRAESTADQRLHEAERLAAANHRLAQEEAAARKIATDRLATIEQGVGPAVDQATLPQLAGALDDLDRKLDPALKAATFENTKAVLDRAPSMKKAIEETAATIMKVNIKDEKAVRAMLKPSSVPSLIIMLRDSDRLVRLKAAQLLRIMGGDAKSAIPALIEAMTDKDVLVRSAAIAAIGAMGPDAAPALPALRKALRDEEFFGVAAAVAAITIGDLGELAKPAVPDLILLLRRRSMGGTLGVLAALAKLGPLAADAAPAVIETLRDIREPSIRKGCLAALASFGPAAEPALPQLLEILDGPDPDLRARACEVLAKCPSAAAKALPALITAANGENAGNPVDRILQNVCGTRCPSAERRTEGPQPAQAGRAGSRAARRKRPEDRQSHALGHARPGQS